MNLTRLEYFLTLAQCGNLRRASDLLHVSPPALSKAMKVLEEELELKLWTRDGRKLILTDAGKTLLKKAPRLVDELRTLKESLTNEKSESGPVRIATFEVFSTYFLSHLEETLGPDRSLELHELLPGEVERHVSQGDVDVGITYLPIPDPDLDFLKVGRIEMGVFTRKDAFKGIPQQQLPYVIPVIPLQGVPTKVRGLDGWPDDAYRRKLLHRVTLMESAVELCRQGQVAGYFPAFIVEEHNKRVREPFQLERRRLSGAVPCYASVFLVKRKSSAEDDTIRKIARALRRVCAK